MTVKWRTSVTVEITVEADTLAEASHELSATLIRLTDVKGVSGHGVAKMLRYAGRVSRSERKEITR